MRQMGEEVNIKGYVNVPGGVGRILSFVELRHRCWLCALPHWRIIWPLQRRHQMGIMRPTPHPKPDELDQS